MLPIYLKRYSVLVLVLAISYCTAHIFDKKINDLCSTSEGTEGICLHPQNCPGGFLKKVEDICSFEKITPIVCCAIAIPTFPPLIQPTIENVSYINGNPTFDITEDMVRFNINEANRNTTNVNLTNARVVEKYCESVHNLTEENNISIESSVAILGWADLDGNVDWRCIGVVIRENFILSAADCILTKEFSPDVIAAGDLDFTKEISSDNFHIFNATRIILHPEYDPLTMENNIALIEISRASSFIENVNSVCLWPFEDSFQENFIRIGYGIDNEVVNNSTYGSTRVLNRNFTYVNETECRKTYNVSTEWLHKQIFSSQICAYRLETKKISCENTTSGSLLFAKAANKPNRIYLIGINTFGSDCFDGFPEVYTKVYSYLDWLEGLVWRNELFINS